jgi:hypothetical protein
MSTRASRESTLEAVFREGVEKLNGKAAKFVSPGWAGVTDRIVILPHLPVHFVELKKTGKPLEPLQLLFRDFVIERGHPHAVLDSPAKVATWLAERHREIARAKALQ